MNLLYKPIEADLHFKFSNMYLEFAQSDNKHIRFIIAKSLHEAFNLVTPDEDVTDIYKCFLHFILSDNKEVLIIMNQNLSSIIQNYGNKFTLENFKGRTPFSEEDGDITPEGRSAS